MSEFDDTPFANCEPEPVHCNGEGCNNTMESLEGDIKYHPWARSDHYGLFTGIYCDDCYPTNYPYRTDDYYDPAYAGEELGDDESWGW
jgi:hypothetical protein